MHTKNNYGVTFMLVLHIYMIPLIVFIIKNYYTAAPHSSQIWIRLCWYNCNCINYTC